MTDSQRWLVLAGLLATGWLLYLLAPVLIPFVFSGLLAYLGNPFVRRLQSRGLSRTLAVVAVFAGMLLLILVMVFLLIPLLERQVVSFIQRVPAYLDWMQRMAVPWLENRLGMQGPLLDLDRLKQIITIHWAEAGGLAASIVSSVSRSGMALLGWLASLVLVPVVTFYLLRDWDRILEYLYALLPERLRPAVVRFVQEADEVLAGFLRGQLLVMLSLGVLYSLGLWIIGLDNALLIGLLAGLVSFVPYLGLILGVLIAGLASLIQGQGLLHLLLVLAVFGIGQVLESMLLTPKLVGNRIRLHPVVIIFVVLAAGRLFGFLGILLAIPVAAVGAVAFRHAYEHYAGGPLSKTGE